jgi:ribA/ribD-fused uncharacterized protein
MADIFFYETDKPYGCFSNFSSHSVLIEGRVWPTTEHFFQAAKFSDAADVDAAADAKTPFLAAQLGRERHRSFRPDWNVLRDGVMLKALRAKFEQHPALAAALASTGSATLVEHTKNDRYWADGGDGSGRNRLGELLEQVRAELAPWPVPFQAPPWLAHPDIEPSDMFWRMGRGEDVLSRAQRFHTSLAGEAKLHFDAYFPVPVMWQLAWPDSEVRSGA